MHRNGNRPWALWETSPASEFVARAACADLAGANRFVRCCMISRTRRIFSLVLSELRFDVAMQASEPSRRPTQIGVPCGPS